MEKVAKTKVDTLSLAAMQEVLWESINKIRTDETTAANVNAISNATGKILATIKVAMEYSRLTGKAPNIPLLLGPGDE